jgi:hypothetical protein
MSTLAWSPHLRRRVTPLALVAALAASPLPASAADTNPSPPAPHYTWSQTPSRVWLKRPDDTYARLRPWTYCWSSPPKDGEYVTVCADGFPPPRDEMLRLTSGRAARFWFGRPNWKFEATIASLSDPADQSCQSTADANRVRPRWFRLARPDRPGVYQVDLFGKGPEGDVFVTFKWRVGRWDTATAC